MVDTFVTEVSQDTWIYFPWDMGFTYQKPIADGHARLSGTYRPDERKLGEPGWQRHFSLFIT